MADIFVSYTSSDRDWAFWIGQELEKLGHTPRIHEWEIRGSEDIYAWMEKHHDAADHVLCVISDEYLLAPYSTLERNAALWQAASKRPGFVLFVVVKPCRIPTLSDHIRRCTLHGLAEDEARKRFLEFMAPPGRPAGHMPFPGSAVATSQQAKAPVAFPGGPHALSNIPIAVPLHFLGREDELKGIKTALGRGDGRVAITALHGLRGVGKTVLAAAYAERHHADYRATWWIRAQGESGMRADLVALGVRLGWVAVEEKEEPALVAVMERLRHEGDGILLIFDNAIDAEAIRPYLPRGGAARIIVTSNAPNWRGIAAPVEIEVWPKETGADYLIARTGRDGEREAALALSEALGGLPLAHEQAAAYCERLGVSLADYRKRFEAAPAPLLDDQRDASREYHDGTTVAKTFALAIDEAAKLHPAAEPLIVHAALLAPEPIPLFLFAEARTKFDEPLASSLADDGLDEAVAALRAFALVGRETIPDERDPSITTECIRLHRLVRQVAAARRNSKELELVRPALVDALALIYPRQVHDNPQSWPRARRVDGLALAIVGPDADVPIGSEEKASILLNELASYRQSALAAYPEALQLMQSALSICEIALGEHHAATAKYLNGLASLLRAQGKPARAQPLLERALSIAEEVFGVEHPVTATYVHNLAGLLRLQGKIGKAKKLYERAFAIREKSLGAGHPDTANSLNSLAILVELGGDLTEARALRERALSICEKTFGLDHPNTNLVRRNLAFLLLEVEHTAAAFTQSAAALAGDERIFGVDHPSTKKSAHVVALVLDALGRADESKVLREKYGIEARAGRKEKQTKKLPRKRKK